MTIMKKCSWRVFCIFIFYLGTTQALECHNCFSSTNDQCQQLSIEKLGEKLRQNERRGRESALIVSRYADACLLYVTEFGDDNGNQLRTIVRTQIETGGESNVFAKDQLTARCDMRTAGSRIEQGVRVTTRYCACTADYCNGQSSLFLSRGGLFSKVLLFPLTVIVMNHLRR